MSLLLSLCRCNTVKNGQKAHICYLDLYVSSSGHRRNILFWILVLALKYVYPFGIWIGLVIIICRLRRDISNHFIWKPCIFQMTNLNFLFSRFYKWENRGHSIQVTETQLLTESTAKLSLYSSHLFKSPNLTSTMG